MLQVNGGTLGWKPICRNGSELRLCMYVRVCVCACVCLCEDEEGGENAAGQWRYFGLEADLQEWK
jgi:hypothetical protein